MTSTANPPSFDEPPADRSAGPPPLDATPLTDRIFVVDRTLGVEIRCPSLLATHGPGTVATDPSGTAA